MLTRLYRLAVLSLLTLPVAPSWAVTGVMLRDDDLRASALATSAKLGMVKKGKSIEVMATRGGWTLVKWGGLTGWVRLLSVRRGAASQTDYQASLGSAQTAANSPLNSGAIVATSGLRGLDVAQLSAANFNAQELDALERHAATRGDAQGFAAQAGLTARSVAYLPAPLSGVEPANATGGP
jgi:hypothetical protein